MGRVRDGAQYAARNRSLAEVSSHIQPGLQDLSRIRSELQGVGRLDLGRVAKAEAASVAAQAASAAPEASVASPSEMAASPKSPPVLLPRRHTGDSATDNLGSKGRSTFSDPFYGREDVSQFSLRTDGDFSGADFFISSLEDAAVARALSVQGLGSSGF